MVYCLTIILFFQEAVMAYIKERGNPYLVILWGQGKKNGANLYLAFPLKHF